MEKIKDPGSLTATTHSVSPGLNLLVAVFATLAAVMALPAVAQPEAGSRPDGSSEGLIFVSNEKGHNISVLDPESLEVIHRIETSRRPRAMSFSPDRSLLYVACGDDDVIDVIDMASLTVVDQIPTGPSPEAFQLNHDGSRLWVSNESNATVGLIDVERKTMIEEISTGPEPEGVTISPDGRSLYVTSEVADMVHVVDIESRQITDHLIVGTRPRRSVFTSAEEVWTSAELSGEVYIIDTTEPAIVETITFLPDGMRLSDVTPVGMALSPDGSTMAVTLGHASHIALVDVASREIQEYVLVGSRPWEARYSSDGSRLYVTNGMSDDLSVIDTDTRRVIRSVPVGQVPYGVLIND